MIGAIVPLVAAPPLALRPSQIVVTSSRWAAIHDRGCGLVIAPRSVPVSIEMCEDLVREPEGTFRVSGARSAVAALLAGFDGGIVADIAWLAGRFAALMAVDAVRVRLEVVTSNACWKWHLDYADVRLVTTYAGPGTQYRDGEIEREVPAGAIGLFKGNLYGPGHATVPHRSPPIAGTGARRLVLVIDTPLADA